MEQSHKQQSADRWAQWVAALSREQAAVLLEALQRKTENQDQK